MPWYNGDYPPSYKNQPKEIREKAVEIANEVLLDGAEEGIAIATGLKRAREFFKNEDKKGTATKKNNHPEDSVGKSGKLSDYPEGNLESEEFQNHPEGKTIAQATDPSKLSDI